MVKKHNVITYSTAHNQSHPLPPYADLLPRRPEMGVTLLCREWPKPDVGP
jgi:hypothetical protein